MRQGAGASGEEWLASTSGCPNPSFEASPFGAAGPTTTAACAEQRYVLRPRAIDDRQTFLAAEVLQQCGVRDDDSARHGKTRKLR